MSFNRFDENNFNQFFFFHSFPAFERSKKRREKLTSRKSKLKQKLVYATKKNKKIKVKGEFSQAGLHGQTVVEKPNTIPPVITLDTSSATSSDASAHIPELIRDKTAIVDGRLVPLARVSEVTAMIDLVGELNRQMGTALSYFVSSLTGTGYDVLTADGKYYAVYPQVIYAKSIESSSQEKSYLHIKLVQDIQSGEWHILKSYQVNDGSLIDNIRSEINLLIQAGQFVSSVDSLAYNQTLYVIKHYAPGYDLTRLLREEISFEEKLFASIKMTEAMLRLHHHCQLLHCDIKLDNVVYDRKSGTATLIDFDVSLSMEGSAMAVSDKLRGTFGYLAPELLRSENKYVFNEKTEVYAFGMTLAKWFGVEAFLSSTSGLSEQTLFRPELSSQQSLVLPLIKAMVSDDPVERPTFEGVLRQLQALAPALEPRKSFMN